jgi:predicted AAA+ superfamily ATPase
MYIQVVHLLEDVQTIQQEYAPLETIPDSYEKIVISLDDIALPSYNGIRHIQAWEWERRIIHNL